jgi:hypothetical protein
VNAHDAKQVKAVLNELRKAESLPDDDDFDFVIPPVLPAWRRPVPQTELWVVYRLDDAGVHVPLWMCREFDVSYLDDD